MMYYTYKELQKLLDKNRDITIREVNKILLNILEDGVGLFPDNNMISPYLNLFEVSKRFLKIESSKEDLKIAVNFPKGKKTIDYYQFSHMHQLYKQLDILHNTCSSSTRNLDIVKYCWVVETWKKAILSFFYITCSNTIRNSSLTEEIVSQLTTDKFIVHIRNKQIEYFELQARKALEEYASKKDINIREYENEIYYSDQQDEDCSKEWQSEVDSWGDNTNYGPE